MQNSSLIETDDSSICENHSPAQMVSVRISIQIEDQAQQKEWCGAIAFNKDGSIMAAVCDKQIKIWEIQNGKLQSTANVLLGHTDYVCCLVFSKKINFFVSGSDDSNIRCWKEIKQNNWVSSQPGSEHLFLIQCLLLNNDEDQLLSSSSDASIKIWNVDCNKNILTYQYSLDRHTSTVFGISLNESETSLVSCSYDKSIIIWGKGQQHKWEFKYFITKSIDDWGYRITFMNDNVIAWQQQGQGITNIFELDKGVFQERSELQIVLNKLGSDGQYFFPSVYNRKRQILIQKHNNFVYIIRQYNDGKFRVEPDPINCRNEQSFGGLTNSGQNLVIWNYKINQLTLYRITYE